MTSSPNPRRVAAGKANGRKAGPLTDSGRQRLREAALRNKPWLRSTGPKTDAGKARVAQNSRKLVELSSSERFLVEVRLHAAALARLRCTGYVDPQSAQLKTEDLAVQLKEHFERSNELRVRNLAARLLNADQPHSAPAAEGVHASADR